jgi:hypothetical protein
MGGKSSSENRTRTSTRNDPYATAIPGLSQIGHFSNREFDNVDATGVENNAFAGLLNNAQEGNQFSGRIGLLADDLLAGGTDRTGMVSSNLDEYRTALQPYATGGTNPWENADFSRMVDNVSGDAMDKVKAQYAAAGYNPSATSFGRHVGEGVTNAVTPLAYQATQDLHNRKLAANEALYGAGNTTAGLLSGMDQQSLGNRQAGVDVASRSLAANDAPYARMLEIEAQRRGLPIQNVAQLANLILPLAQVGGTSYSDQHSQSSKTASPVETAMGWAKVGSSIFGGGSGSVASAAKGWF